ncbi:hypothetical protein [Halosimplex carlsbadense]|nr:hypothetical protein [Halosimplex carlsbadense]
MKALSALARNRFDRSGQQAMKALAALAVADRDILAACGRFG